ncbi:MAG: UDP-N-acetylmuramoyl-tripeptide--D-alanyl-D-alanine ligase [Parcubacteria group bacterium]|nr:UDP-N-acetylmuramoyl-tripeptide--D-alanyl-D-alanine ligase [Parcubacteria group bacterium]
MKVTLKTIVLAIITAEARAILRKYRPKVIAITGSVGKTSTKDAIYALLADPTSRKNEKSMNSEIGVPLTIIGAANPWESVTGWLQVMWQGLTLILTTQPYPRTLILEVGADHPGDIKKIASWLMPDIAVITGVPDMPVHVANFDSADAVFEEKAQLAKHLQPEGWLVINGDDERVRTLANGTNEKTITYGITHGALRAQNVQTLIEHEKPVGVRFDVFHAGASTPCILRGCLGNGHVLSTLAAFAVAFADDKKLAGIAAQCAKHTPPAGRMRILDGVNGSTIIDDSYNSSPAAALLALETLKSIPTQGRRIAALGDMRELGALSKEAHEIVGRRAAEVVSQLITVGEESRVLADAAKRAGLLEIKSYGYGESQKAGEELAGELRAGDIVLVKGSQNMIRMERFVKAIMAEPARAPELLVRQEPEWLIKK